MEVPRPGVEVSRPGVVEPESSEFRFPFPFPRGRPAAGCSWAPGAAPERSSVPGSSGPEKPWVPEPAGPEKPWVPGSARPRVPGPEGPKQVVIPVISGSISRWILELRVEAFRVEALRGGVAGGGVREGCGRGCGRRRCGEGSRVEEGCGWRRCGRRRNGRQLRLSVRGPAVRLDRDGVGDGDGGHRVRGGRDCCGESGQHLRIGDGRRG